MDVDTNLFPVIKYYFTNMSLKRVMDRSFNFNGNKQTNIKEMNVRNNC